MENGEVIDRWIISKSFPQYDQKGVLQSTVGCVMDISISKHHYFNQIKRVEEVKELKRQQDVSMRLYMCYSPLY